MNPAQMAALGVQTDYIKYMMGHTTGTYHDIRMKGIAFLRGVYAASSLSIKQNTKPDRIQMLKEIVRALGLNPEEISTKEALAKPHRTVVVGAQQDYEQGYVGLLMKALRQKLKDEITAEMTDAVLKPV